MNFMVKYSYPRVDGNVVDMCVVMLTSPTTNPGPEGPLSLAFEKCSCSEKCIQAGWRNAGSDSMSAVGLALWMIGCGKAKFEPIDEEFDKVLRQGVNNMTYGEGVLVLDALNREYEAKRFNAMFENKMPFTPESE